MPGLMLVRQRVASVARWAGVFGDPVLDAVRRRHGLVVTGIYVDGEAPDTIIVLMDMSDIALAREFAGSAELAAARSRAGAVGPPDAVWYAPREVASA